MMQHRILQFFAIAGTLLCAIAILMFCKQEAATAVSTYYGPTQPLQPGQAQLVKVQILVYDDPNPTGAQVLSVTFNGQTIALKPRDVDGFRGSAGFQVPPGNYPLIWQYSNSGKAWPRSVTDDETISVSPRDLWLQITVQGAKLTLS